MRNKSTRTRILVFVAVVIGLIALGQILQTRCYARPNKVDANSVISINNLYPWPGAKIPFACHIIAFLKSPFAPRMIYYNEMVFKEDGFPILKGDRREGVFTADISIAGDLLPTFDEPMRYGTMPLFVKSISFYVDGKELQIGHIGYREPDLEFNFATILNPFLLPGKHVGKIVLLLPSSETLEYEWQFEITWW